MILRQPNPRRRVYFVRADPKRHIRIFAIAKDPNGRRAPVESVKPEQNSVVGVTEKQALDDDRVFRFSCSAVASE